MGPTRLLCLCSLLTSCWLLLPYRAYAGGGSNFNHEMMVYSLQYYGTFLDSCSGQTVRWKNSVPLSSYKDPYREFWDAMYTNCSGTQCAHTSSQRWKDSWVKVNMMNGEAANDGWNDVDLVFFYGHNTTIQPQWPHSFELWRQISQTQWCEYSIFDWRDWGTAQEPYRYHRDMITNASYRNAYAVFYAYNPFTSILVGKDFTQGDWYTENYWNQPTPNVNQGQIGSYDTEWVIAHGCNAVTTAKYQNNNPGDPIIPYFLGVQAWYRSWDRLHLVLGHYYTTTTYHEPNLATFAAALKSGDVIRNAYFDVHSSGYSWDPAYAMPSAISVSHRDCCTYSNGWICPWGTGCPTRNYMYQETWTSPLPDPQTPVTLNNFFFVSWKEYE